MALTKIWCHTHINYDKAAPVFRFGLARRFRMVTLRRHIFFELHHLIIRKKFWNAIQIRQRCTKWAPYTYQLRQRWWRCQIESICKIRDAIPLGDMRIFHLHIFHHHVHIHSWARCAHLHPTWHGKGFSHMVIMIPSPDEATFEALAVFSSIQ